MTLEKIRAALPTHIMLTPGVHRWRDGDEFVSGAEWEPICGPLGVVGNDIKPFQLARRPIHPHILDSQAWWLYVQQLIGKNFNVYTWVQYTNYMHPMYKKVLSKIGGVGMCTQRNEEGRLYDKWLLEQMEDV